MTNIVNRIGFPVEVDCPDCGRPITGEEDMEGIVYQCESLDCGSTYSGEDLFPENYAPKTLNNNSPTDNLIREKWTPDAVKDAVQRVSARTNGTSEIHNNADIRLILDALREKEALAAIEKLPRYSLNFCDRMEEHSDGGWCHIDDVRYALTPTVSDAAQEGDKP